MDDKDELEGLVQSAGQMSSGTSPSAQARLTVKLIESIRELTGEIKHMRQETSKSSDKLLVLTWVLVVLTIFMAFPVLKEFLTYVSPLLSRLH